MKKIVMIVTILVMTFTFVVDDKALAVSAPEKVKEVDCPPSYVGGKKCYMVVNPETRPKKVTKPSVPLPKNKEPIKTTKEGKALTGNPYYYIFGAIGTIAAVSESDNTSFLNWVESGGGDKARATAVKVAGAVSETSALALQIAWEDMIHAKSEYLELSSVVWNEIFGESVRQLSAEEELKLLFKAEAVTSSYEDNPNAGAIVRTLKQQFVNYVLGNVYYKDVYNDKGVYMYRDYGFRGIGTQRTNDSWWNIIQGSYLSHWDNATTSWSPYSNWTKAQALDIRGSFIYETPSGYQQLKPDVKVKGTSNPWGLSTSGNTSQYVPPSYHGNVVDPSTQTEVSVGGETFIEVPGSNPLNEPDLQPMPQRDSPAKPKLPGTKTVTEDGVEIDESTGKEKSPIVTPIPNPNPSPSPNPNPNPNPSPSPAPQPAPLPPKTEPPTTGEEPDPDSPNRNPDEDGNRFGALVTNKFPFSLPWDIYNMISALVAEPKRPEVKVDLSGQTFMGKSAPIKFSHDFKWMDDYAPFMRTFILIGFTIFLITSTRRLMGGGQ